MFGINCNAASIKTDSIASDSLWSLTFEVMSYDLDSSLALALDLTGRYEKDGDPIAGVHGNNLLGFIHYYRDEHQEAINAYNRSNEIIADQEQYNTVKADNYLGLSSVSAMLGHYDATSDYILKAQEFIPDEEDSWKDVIYVYQNIAQCFYDIGDFSSAMNYCKLAESLFNKHRDQLQGGRSVTQGLLADLLQIRGDLDSAEVLARDEMVFAKANDEKIGLLYSYEILAAIAYQRGQLDSAIALQQRSTDIAHEYGDRFSTILEGAILGLYQLEAGNLAEVSEIVELISELGAGFPPNLARKRMLELLYKYEEARANYQEALAHYKEFSAIEVKMKGAGFSEELLRSKYLLSEKENDLLELKSTLQDQRLETRNFWMYVSAAGTILLAILLALSVLSFYNIKKYNRKLSHKQDLLNTQRNSLAELNKELADANKNKDKLLSILSHDVRQPFNQTISLLQLLEGLDLPDPTYRELIVSIKGSVSEHKHSIENLLTWSKSQLSGINTIPEQTELEPVMADITNSIRSSLQEKSIVLMSQFDKDLSLFVDPGQLSIILQNLLVNAIKFSHESGRIEFSALKKEDRVLLSIKDFGVGMSDEKVQKLLDKNQQFSESGTLNEKGSGFGMLIVAEFVEENEGILEVISTEGEGSEFVVSFPAEATA